MYQLGNHYQEIYLWTLSLTIGKNSLVLVEDLKLTLKLGC